jgi:hypothetical protein
MSLDARSLADNPPTLAAVPTLLARYRSREPCVLYASLAARRAQVVAAGLQRATC